MTSQRTVSIWHVQKVLCFLITVLTPPVYSCDICNSCKSTILAPKDALVFVGETLRITCGSPIEFEGGVSTIRFGFTAGKKNWFYPNENVTDIGNSTAEIKVLITEDFTATTSLACYNGNRPICSTKIYVENPFRDISDFAGVFFRDQIAYTMVMWSSSSKNYLRSRDIKVEAKFLRGYVRQADWENANSCNTSEMCTVEFHGENVITFHFKVFYAGPGKRPKLEYLQPLYETHVEKQEYFYLRDNLKTGAVTGLSVTEIHKTRVDVKWKLPYYFSILCQASICPWILYKIRIQTADYSEERFLEGKQDHSKANKPIKIWDLTAATSYRLTVWVKQKEINPWSDVSDAIKFTTAAGDSISKHNHSSFVAVYERLMIFKTN